MSSWKRTIDVRNIGAYTTSAPGKSASGFRWKPHPFILRFPISLMTDGWLSIIDDHCLHLFFSLLSILILSLLTHLLTGLLYERTVPCQWFDYHVTQSGSRQGTETTQWFKEKNANITHYYIVGSSRYASVVTNPTRIHEDVGSIPGLTPWVKDPALLQAEV